MIHPSEYDSVSDSEYTLGPMSPSAYTKAPSVPVRRLAVSPADGPGRAGTDTGPRALRAARRAVVDQSREPARPR